MKHVLPRVVPLSSLSLPPASPLPCSSVPVSSRTTSRFRGLSDARDVGPGRLDHPRRRHPHCLLRSFCSLHGPLRGSPHIPHRNRGAHHRGPSSDGSQSSLSQRTTTREKVQPLQMATRPGSGCTSTSTWLPAPSARGRALERHKQPFPVTSRAHRRGGPAAALAKSNLRFPQSFTYVHLEGQRAKARRFSFPTPNM